MQANIIEIILIDSKKSALIDSMAQEDKDQYLKKYIRQTSNNSKDNIIEYDEQSEHTNTLIQTNNKTLERKRRKRKVQSISITMTKPVDTEIPLNKIAFNMLASVSKLVKAQYENGNIDGIIRDDESQDNLNETDMCDQVSNIQIIGKKKQKTQVFISMVMKCGFGELIKHQLLLIKEQELMLVVKHTVREHTSRIGIIIGPNLEYENPRYYKKLIKDYMQYEESIIKIKKEIIYERDYRSVEYALYTTNSTKEQVDNDMQVIVVGNSEHFEYISFCYTLSNIKICSLYVNEVNNIEV